MRSLILLSSNCSNTYERTGRLATGSRAFGTSCNQKPKKKKKDFVKQKQIKKRENGGEEILSERP